MSQFVEVKTAELTGQALDWAVAVACGYECVAMLSNSLTMAMVCNASDGRQYVIGQLHGASMIEELKTQFFRPSTSWAQGGPLLENYNIGIESGVSSEIPYAYIPGRDLEGSYGETALIAICRAIVVANLGDVVQVPAELVEVDA